MQEYWLRGIQVNGIVPQLQPAAHALLQAVEEWETLLAGFPVEQLWTTVAGCASVGFHLKHIIGFLDRLLTYAEGKSLTQQQLVYLKNETGQEVVHVDELLNKAIEAVSTTLNRYKSFTETILCETRKVGRAGLPSTVIGLCFHAAEHTMRHTGQLWVTVHVLKRS